MRQRCNEELVRRAVVMVTFITITTSTTTEIWEKSKSNELAITGTIVMATLILTIYRE